MQRNLSIVVLLLFLTVMVGSAAAGFPVESTENLQEALVPELPKVVDEAEPTAPMYDTIARLEQATVTPEETLEATPEPTLEPTQAPTQAPVSTAAPVSTEEPDLAPDPTATPAETQPQETTASAGAEPATDAEYMIFTATAYCPCKKCCGKWSIQDENGNYVQTLSFTGQPPQEGVTIAADSSVLPKGTRVYIEGVGERIVQDSGVKGKKIDVFFATHEAACAFGMKQVKLRILE